MCWAKSALVAELLGVHVPAVHATYRPQRACAAIRRIGQPDVVAPIGALTSPLVPRPPYHPLAPRSLVQPSPQQHSPAEACVASLWQQGSVLVQL